MKLLTEVENSFTPADPIKISMVDSDSGGCLKQLEIAIKAHPDDAPFFLVDMREIQYKAMAWKRYLPRVSPFHSLKLNSNSEVVELLGKAGCGFEIGSKKDLELALSLNLDAGELIFSNPCKPNSHIKSAAAAGVNILTFDNDHELRKIKKLHPRARLMLRINTWESDCEFEESFGAVQSDWSDLIDSCRDLELDLIGVSFHIGKTSQNLDQFPLAIAQASEVFKLAQCAGFDLSVLDIGSGFPAGSDSLPLFEDVADSINSALSIHFPSNVRIVAEPSRYLTGSAFTLVTRVTSVLTGNDGKRQIYINDGVYGNFGNAEHPIPRVVNQTGSTPEVKYSIWGSSMDGFDLLSETIQLPVISAGDYLAWAGIGHKNRPTGPGAKLYAF